MYYKLLFLSLFLSISSLSLAQTEFNFVDDTQTKGKKEKMTKKSGQVTSSAKSKDSSSSSSELSSEWDLESITQEVQTLENDLKGAKSSNAEFNDIRVIKIQLEERKSDLEKAKMIAIEKSETIAQVQDQAIALGKGVDQCLIGNQLIGTAR